MHSTFHHELAAARIADRHQHAAQEQMAQAACRARRARRAQEQQRIRPVPGHAVAFLARRVLTLAGARSPSPTR
jgi:hypothetical protein